MVQQIAERPVTVRPRPLRWPASAALQLLTSGGVQSSWRRPDRVYIKDGLDAVTWPANNVLPIIHWIISNGKCSLLFLDIVFYNSANSLSQEIPPNPPASS